MVMKEKAHQRTHSLMNTCGSEILWIVFILGILGKKGRSHLDKFAHLLGEPILGTESTTNECLSNMRSSNQLMANFAIPFLCLLHKIFSIVR